MSRRYGKQDDGEAALICIFGLVTCLMLSQCSDSSAQSSGTVAFSPTPYEEMFRFTRDDDARRYVVTWPGDTLVFVRGESLVFEKRDLYKDGFE